MRINYTKFENLISMIKDIVLQNTSKKLLNFYRYRIVDIE